MQLSRDDLVRMSMGQVPPSLAATIEVHLRNHPADLDWSVQVMTEEQRARHAALVALGRKAS